MRLLRFPLAFAARGVVAAVGALLFAASLPVLAQVFPLACPGCCSSHGGITNSCASNGRVYCKDGTISPSCLCSSCGVSPPPTNPTPALGQLQMPGTIAFADTTLGATSATTSVTLRNIGGITVTVSSVTSSAPSEFLVVSSACNTVASNATCSVTLAFAPTAAGARNATIRVTSSGVGSPQSFQVTGVGVAPSSPPPGTTPPAASAIEIVEFFHKEWDHYFVTGIPQELTKLDAGDFAGWERTGLSFKAWPLGTPGTVNVCRFFSTSFMPRSSHFYTPVASECTTVKSSPDWSFEGEVFGIILPTSTGMCPMGTVPLYRLYNNGDGGAPNHRYTTILGVRSLMASHGWIPEGNGDLGIIACAAG